jgi:hypothetical protein
MVVQKEIANRDSGERRFPLQDSGAQGTCGT